MTASKEGQESRRTLSDSSAEDVRNTGSRTRTNDDEMWRNELAMNTDSSSVQPEKREERSHRTGNSNAKLSDAVDVVLRVLLVITFL